MMGSTAAWEGTEAIGGSLTGPIWWLVNASCLAFFVASVVAFTHLRAADVVALVACALCLPYLLYTVAPGPFRLVIGGNYSAPAPATFLFDRGHATALILVGITACVSLIGLRRVQSAR